MFDHIAIRIVFNFIFQGDVECFYDAESQVIYLHLRSLSDVHRVAALCQRLVSEKSSKVGFTDWYWYNHVLCQVIQGTHMHLYSNNYVEDFLFASATNNPIFLAGFFLHLAEGGIQSS